MAESDKEQKNVFKDLYERLLIEMPPDVLAQVRERVAREINPH
jgi:hypothetical protein